MVGDATGAAASWRAWLRDVLQAASPLQQPRMHKWARGHVFAHDGDALRDLQVLTREVRLGLGGAEDDAGGTDLSGTPASAATSMASSGSSEDQVPPYRRYE